MSKHQVIQGVAILLLAVHFAGCSTLFGRHQDEQLVYFDANVPDVEVVCEGKRAITPGSIALRQSKSHACLAEKSGYRKEVIEIKSLKSSQEHPGLVSQIPLPLIRPPGVGGHWELGQGLDCLWISRRGPCEISSKSMLISK